MDGLSPHIDYRIAGLRNEAEARRLAAMGEPSDGPSRERSLLRDALAVAAAIVILSASVGVSSGILASSADPAMITVADDPSTFVKEPGSHVAHHASGVRPIIGHR